MSARPRKNLLVAAPDGTEAYYYRTSGGAEVDLLLAVPGQKLWAVEVKRSTAPVATRGFHSACADLKPARRLVVCPGSERIPLPAGVEAVPVRTLAEELAQAGGRA